MHQYSSSSASSAQRAGSGQRPARSQRIPSPREQVQAASGTGAVRRIRVRVRQGMWRWLSAPAQTRPPLRFLLGQCAGVRIRASIRRPMTSGLHSAITSPAAQHRRVTCSHPPIHCRLKRSRDSTGGCCVSGGTGACLASATVGSLFHIRQGGAALRRRRVTQVACGVIAAGLRPVLATMSCSTTSYSELHSPRVAERRVLERRATLSASTVPCVPPSSMCRSLARHTKVSCQSVPAIAPRNNRCWCGQGRTRRRLATGGR
jgi:hypothetical protein